MEQIRSLPGLFDFDTGHRKANERILKLSQAKRLNRHRPALDRSFVCYLGRRPENLEHRLALNWTYIWHLKRLEGW
ncbi:MAG: hypothetical protein ABSC17_10605, partial [Thermacetogeniaceae bacterium]